MTRHFSNIRNTYARMTPEERAQCKRILEERERYGLQITDLLVQDTQAFVLADRPREAKSAAERAINHWRGELACHGGDVLTT